MHSSTTVPTEAPASQQKHLSSAPLFQRQLMLRKLPAREHDQGSSSLRPCYFAALTLELFSAPFFWTISMFSLTKLSSSGIVSPRVDIIEAPADDTLRCILSADCRALLVRREPAKIMRFKHEQRYGLAPASWVTRVSARARSKESMEAQNAGQCLRSVDADTAPSTCIWRLDVPSG